MSIYQLIKYFIYTEDWSNSFFSFLVIIEFFNLYGIKHIKLFFHFFSTVKSMVINRSNIKRIYYNIKNYFQRFANIWVCKITVTVLTKNPYIVRRLKNVSFDSCN